MKQSKRAITLLTLTAFLCSLQGCASGNTQPGKSSHQHYSTYHSPHSRPDFTAEPTQHYKKAEDESDSHGTALALGVGTGAIIGIAALIAIFCLGIAGASLANGIPMG